MIEPIINGVDVSGCSGYCPELGKYNCIALACNSAAICKQSPNCYYKQLQRRIAECEESHTELKFKVEYIQEQREVIKDLEKKLKIAIEALKDIYDKADEIYFDQYRTSLFCKQVRGISIQALEELE